MDLLIPRLNAVNVIDARALLAVVEPGSIAAAFFDPQYRGVLDHLDYGNEGERQKARANLPQMPEEIIRECLWGINAALQPSGHCFLWVDKFHLCQGTFAWLEGTTMSIVDMITWDKLKMGMGYRSRRRAEHVIVLQKEPKRAKAVWTDHGIPDVWPEKAPKGQHPHRKPVELTERLILAVTKPGDTVLDPAAGGYGVAIAAMKHNRRFIGGDLVLPPVGLTLEGR